MDGTTLRELQAPLKQRYRDEPASAVTPLQATGSFDDLALARLATLTERYCVVAQSLAELPSIRITRAESAG
jgi:hypothetical protein